MKNQSSTTSENKFPYEGFPVRVEFYEGTGKNKITRVAHFSCKEHAERQIERYQLTKRQYKMEIRRGVK